MGNTSHGSRRKRNAENEKKGEPMNKRQAKKQYKRIHGYNPPSERKLSAVRRKVYEEYHITPEQLAAALSQSN
jgi:hypothetical protein